MTRILLSGCNGRMGRVISESLLCNPKCKVVAGIDVFGSSLFDYPVYPSFEECKIDFDVIIDFSSPKALPDLCRFSLEKKKPVVIATTGLSAEDKELYSILSCEVPVFVSANMSLGINLLIALAKKATIVLNENFDIEIVEAHHNQKKDSPSGTALMIADNINQAAGGKYSYVYDRHDVNQARGKEELGIHAIRGGTIIGDHTVYFAGKEELIELTHRAQSRNVFAQGAISAAVFIADKSPGLYSMTDLIGV